MKVDGEALRAHNNGVAADDRLAGLLCELRDISVRKEIEDSLQQSQCRLQALFDHTQDAILWANDEAHYVDVNPAACALLGYSRDELLKLNLWNLTPAVSCELGRQLWQAFITVGCQAGEYALQRKDETTIVVEYRAVANIVPGLHLSVLHDVTERKRAEEELLHQRDQARALARRLADTQEIERQALARELHDQVGQNLTGLDLNLNIIQDRLAAVSAPAKEVIQSRLAGSLALVDEMAGRVRDLIGELSPSVLDDFGLLAALEWYGRQLASRMDVTITVQGQEPAPRLAAAVEHTLFRITQEALTNVAKHAQASAVTLTIDTDDGVVRLVIADDGVGFEPVGYFKASNWPGWGLLTMAERAEAVGGCCRIESKPGQGTRVIVAAPQLAK